MTEFEIPNHLVEVIQVTIKQVQYKIRIEGQTSETFRISNKLRQGDALSYTLFNLTQERAIRLSGINTNRTICKM